MKKKLEISRQDHGIRIAWEDMITGELAISSSATENGSSREPLTNKIIAQSEANAQKLGRRCPNASVKSYACKHCDYETDKSANLSRHIKSMHNKSAQMLSCCGKVFQSKSEYRLHNKMEHKDGHICPICNKSFSRRALLKRHSSVHSGVREFRCDFCCYDSSHKSNVLRHMKTHRHSWEDGRTPNTVRKQSKTGTKTGKVARTQNSARVLKQRKVEEESKGAAPLSHSIAAILDLNESGKDVTGFGVDLTRMELGGEGRDGSSHEAEGGDTNVSSVSHCSDERGSIEDVMNENGNGTCLQQEQSEALKKDEAVEDAHGSWRNTTEGTTYAQLNNFTVLPSPPGMNVTGLPGTNWNSMPTFCSGLVPYPFFGLAAGFGSMFGFEESRLLSSPLIQSPTGGPLPLREAHIITTNGARVPVGAYSHFRPDAQTSAFVPDQNDPNSSETMRKNYEAAYFSSLGYPVEPCFNTFGYRYPATVLPVATHNAATDGNGNSGVRGSPPQAHAHLPAATNQEQFEAQRPGTRLSFTQVTNAQITRFVSY